jgi:hypothetical protein
MTTKTKYCRTCGLRTLHHVTTKLLRKVLICQSCGTMRFKTKRTSERGVKNE